MSELTLHMSSVSDPFVMHIEWTDRNNVKHDTKLAIQVKDRDRETALTVAVNGVITRIDN